MRRKSTVFYMRYTSPSLREYSQRQLGEGSSTAYTRYASPSLREYPQRQLGDRSSTSLLAEKRGFAIDRLSVLPDHVHLMVRPVPKMSIEACALALMNNAQRWMAQRFAPALVKEKVEQLWQS